MTLIPRVVTPRVIVPAVLTPRTTGAPVGGSPFLLLDGSTYATVAAHASLNNLPAANFTAECWLRCDDPTSYQSFLWKRADGDGWYFRFQNDGSLLGVIGGTGSNAITTHATLVADSAWHHVALTFAGAGDKYARLFLDGALLHTSPATLGGDYVGDAANALILGARHAGTNGLTGAMAWARLSNSLRYSGAYTPPLRWPRPALDSNTVEQWNIDEGAGSTLASQVQPWAVRFNGSNTVINYGSDASLDDLPTGGEMTVEAWVKGDSSADNDFTFIINKGDWVNSGWSIYNHSNGRLYAYINLDGDAVICSAATVLDDDWHHIALYYNHTTKVARMAVDGAWGYASSGGSGNYVTDASLALTAGRKASAASGYFTGDLGWVRISDNDRHTAGTDFDGSLPSRYGPPAADGNTVEQWANNEGTGSTAAADVDAGNDGSISNGEWIPTGGINDATLTNGTWGTG